MLISRTFATAAAVVSAIAVSLVGVLAPAGSSSASAAAVAPEYRIAQQTAMPGVGAGVAVDPARGLVYVAGRNSNAVYVYDEETLTLQRSIAVPNQPFYIAVAETGHVYVTQYTGNNLDGTLTVLPPEGIGAALTLPVGKSPVRPMISRDGTKLWVTNYSSGFLSVFDLSDPAHPAPLPNLPLPTSRGTNFVQESPDGSTLFTYEGNTAIFAISPETGALQYRLDNAGFAQDVAFLGGGTRLLAADQTGSTAPIWSLEDPKGPAGSASVANARGVSADPSLGTLFLSSTASSLGDVVVLSEADGSVLQRFAGLSSPYVPATDPTTHSTFVTSISTNQLVKIALAAPMVTRDPTDLTVDAGASAVFSAASTGGQGPVAVAWETSTDGGATWVTIPGATATDYAIDAASADASGTRFRAVFTDANGRTATSGAATLTVLASGGSDASADASGDADSGASDSGAGGSAAASGSAAAGSAASGSANGASDRGSAGAGSAAAADSGAAARGAGSSGGHLARTGGDPDVLPVALGAGALLLAAGALLTVRRALVRD